MHINVIQASDPTSFDYLCMPEQNPINQQYILNQLQHFSNSLTDIGRSFIETSKAIYEKVNDSNTIRLAKAAVRMAKGIFHPNQIVSLETIDAIRAAQPMMQRYIMAEPIIRDLYHKQRIDGYSDTYADIDPSGIGNDHYDYRRVMDGIVQDTTDDKGKDSWVSYNFYEDLHPDDRHLTVDEQIDIINTWSLARMFMEATNSDPTNIFGGEVGA